MLGATPTWPPPDTDRNRFLFRLGFGLGVLASAYVLAFALVSQGWLPFVAAVLLIAGTLMLGIGLLLMRRTRREAEGGSGDDAEAGDATAADDATDDSGSDGSDSDDPGPDDSGATPRPRPRPAPSAH
ncbi:hypothetical protein [Actinomycetospora sp.]|jgi:hypothetical protein|uniref:hypothetical protein n=1 Tax=Actinomycetospora sp. TaxID=1872135 RepID=UPI002F3F484A